MARRRSWTRDKRTATRDRGRIAAEVLTAPNPKVTTYPKPRVPKGHYRIAAPVRDDGRTSFKLEGPYIPPVRRQARPYVRPVETDPPQGGVKPPKPGSKPCGMVRFHPQEMWQEAVCKGREA